MELTPKMSDTAGSFIRKFSICGIPLLSVHREGNATVVKLGPLSLLKLVNCGTRLYGYCGSLKIFKVQYSGVRPLPLEHPSFMPVQRSVKKLFFDIGPLHEKKNARYGMARVASELLKALRKLMPDGYEVYPVYARADRTGYFYANHYLHEHFQNVEVPDLDLPIEISPGDIFINAVTDAEGQQLQKNALHAMRRAGVRILFLFHDLIPITYPEYARTNRAHDFQHWIRLISEFDGIIAVSASAADDYRLWREKNWRGAAPFSIDWFHHGADFTANDSSVELPEDADSVLARIRACPSLLEVSTIEPHKGHRQALAAFEQLWAKGVEASYIIVGKKGSRMKDFCKKLSTHPERGKHLFWLRGISDAYLDAVYNAASGVIMPSEAEGFGLAIIEGAYRGKPLILRDMPVFREIAGDHATYFSGLEPEPLASCIERWLESFRKGAVVPPTGIQPLTWEESARMLLARLSIPDGKEI